MFLRLPGSALLLVSALALGSWGRDVELVGSSVTLDCMSSPCQYVEHRPLEEALTVGFNYRWEI